MDGNMNRFRGDTAVITGASGFIGSRIARRLAAEGARVVLCDWNAEQASALAASIQGEGGEAMALQVDVRKSADAHRAIEAAVAAYGRVDHLICVAGGSTREKMCYFVDQQEDVMLDNIGVNFFGALYFAHAAARHMAARGGGGSLLFIASVLGTQGQRGCVEYSAAKGGLIAMSRALAMEMGEMGVRVNCVSPGLVERGSLDVGSTNYLGRNCTGEEIANVVAFLLSEEASFVTGQNYIVDGGWGTGVQFNLKPIRDTFRARRDTAK